MTNNYQKCTHIKQIACNHITLLKRYKYIFYPNMKGLCKFSQNKYQQIFNQEYNPN